MWLTLPGSERAILFRSCVGQQEHGDAQTHKDMNSSRSLHEIQVRALRFIGLNTKAAGGIHCEHLGITLHWENLPVENVCTCWRS